MRKIYIKLASSLLAVIVALVMVGGVSYAWLTISDSPAVSGIQVAIGGGNTILLAADVCCTVQDEYGNDVVVHYPAAFDETLNFSQHESYSYLNTLTGLIPVSTADGVHWIMPMYDESTGALQDISEFTVDSTLSGANGTEEGEGHYIYLDFWVVSPGSDYELHVSMDTKTGEGSFLMELPEAKETAEGLTLGDTFGRVASTARVGFLANSMVSSNAAVAAYVQSREYDGRFKTLLGDYAEPGAFTPVAASLQNFVVYEPNALLHPWTPEQSGNYILTRPLGYDEMTDTIAETEFTRVTIQDNSAWRHDGEELWLEEIFQASVAGRQSLREEEATAKFYHNYLGGQVAPYVASGNFFANTAAMYGNADETGTVSASTINETMLRAGATDDVQIISLRRNTPQRIRMFIWLEGQDADCTNTDAMSAVSFALGVELSGETKNGE